MYKAQVFQVLQSTHLDICSDFTSAILDYNLYRLHHVVYIVFNYCCATTQISTGGNTEIYISKTSKLPR
jgi:hypothetical protein